MNSEESINSNTVIPPWHKQFWPWMLIALPGSVVIACIITIIISVKYSDDLVVGDYYRAGLGINEKIKKQNTATQFNMSASFNIDRGSFDAGVLRCNLSSNQKIKGNYILVYFRHTINAEHDRTVMLSRTDNKTIFEAPFFKLEKGSYQLTIESSDQQWQLTHRLQQSELLEGLVIKS